MKVLDSLLDFKKGIDQIVATSETAYKTNPTKAISVTTSTAEEIRTIIESGSYEQIVDLSEKFLATSGLYQRTLLYFANLLTYDVLISPKKISNKTVNVKKYQESYRMASFYADTVISPALNFPRMFAKMLIYGAYFGLLLPSDDTHAIIKDLSYKYCRTRFKTYNNNNVLEFDMSYFDAITDSVLREAAFDEFPKVFKKGYSDYLKNKQKNRWFIVPEEIGICFFYLDANKPLMMPVISAIANLNDYKNIEKSSDKQQLEKLIVQKIPTDKDGAFVLDPTEAAELHAGVVKMLGNNSFVDVLTTFAEITVESLGDQTKADRDNLEKIERSVYNEAGVSKQLFAADGSQALEPSIKTDMALAIDIVRQMDNWLTYQVNLQYSENNKYFFEVTTLPITHYNRADVLTSYLKNAEFGYSKILPALASGIKQSSFLDMIEMENDILGIVDKMIPLQSSHTTTTDTSGEGGAPTKKTEEKADKTIKNQEVTS